MTVLSLIQKNFKPGIKEWSSFHHHAIIFYKLYKVTLVIDVLKDKINVTLLQELFSHFTLVLLQI